jgi:hypothetical protein
LKEIKIPNIDATRVMEIVRDLRSQGLVQGKDFDFAYNQSTYDPISMHNIEGKSGKFKFYDDKYATLFALRYAV